MDKKQAKKLLNVARATREGDPATFDMRFVAYTPHTNSIPTFDIRGPIREGVSCGTPACALGHYACRTDLQKSLKLGTRGALQLRDGRPLYGLGRDMFTYAKKTFGITMYEASRLFEGNGCGGAKTPKQAALYIKQFVARKIKEQNAVKRAAALRKALKPYVR